ncbi:MAG: chemotaxis-specific protein-glutamate methyltransferase CheB [Thermodesulfobacteriota bacterium]
MSEPRTPIKVLIVEDSPTAREYLVHIFSSDSEIRVIGTANDGTEAVRLAEKLKPDVITMDIHMPVMDGLEATRKIMETHPVPIVIVSGIWDPREVETTFLAIEAGALVVVQRPAGMGHPDSERLKKELISKVKLMSEVKVVKRWPRSRLIKKEKQPESPTPSVKPRPDIRVVAIGASTGGPPALQTILSGLPADFPVPVLIVQHIATGFIQGMLDWLSETSGLRLHIAQEGEKILGGRAYFAPDNFYMGVDKIGGITLQKTGSAGAIRPSVSHLFRTIAEVYQERLVGILLTGMGSDGAAELKIMREKGAVTIIQDQESSIVFGMPGAARELGAARYELSPEKIATALIQITGHGQKKGIDN